MLKISTMTGKLVYIPAINTNTLTNEYCQKMHSSSPQCICTDCYSFAMLEGSRKNCAPAWEKNSVLLKSNILKELPQFNSLYVRFHGHGELINKTHFINYLLITEHNPKTTFSLFTKRHKLVKRVLETREKPQYFDKVFNTVTQKSTLDNCTGRKCIECLACYTHTGENVLIEKVKARS